jgi:hypothetical protein
LRTPPFGFEPTASFGRFGESGIPEAVAMLLRLMIRLRLKPEQLTEKEFDRIIKLRAQT